MRHGHAAYDRALLEPSTDAQSTEWIVAAAAPIDVADKLAATGDEAGPTATPAQTESSAARAARPVQSAAVHPSYLVSDPTSIAAWRQYVRASAVAHGVSGPGPGHKHKRHSAGLQVTGLTLSHRSMRVTGKAHTAIKFRLTSAAGVTVLVLDRPRDGRS